MHLDMMIVPRNICPRLKEPFTVPVLLLVFNRTDLTRRVFQRIREAKPATLFIAADGPRSDREHDRRHCEDVRRVISEIDWPCEIHRLYHDTNLGCKNAVSAAISWFFEHVEEGIILEDDCLPAPSFFPYCAELLERYRNEPRVAMISGNQLLCGKDYTRRAASYYFSKYPNIWGWATWRRTWRNYDVALSAWDGDSRSLRSITNGKVRRRFGRPFDAVKAGSIDTWDYQLVHHCLTTGALCVTPAVNLVENIGFDARATHTFEPVCANAHARAREMPMPMVHPDTMTVDQKADARMEARVYHVPANLWVSLWWSCGKRRAELAAWLRKRHQPAQPCLANKSPRSIENPDSNSG